MEVTNYYKEIGSYIKKLREKNNMTRSQLADGICSLSYIGRIENGNRCPSSVILRQITYKLGITPEYLFRAIESPTSLHVKEVMNQLTLYIERDDYNSIDKLITQNEEVLCITSIHDIQFIECLKCISKTMLNENYQWGLDELKNILALTYIKESDPTSTEFSIMFSYGFFLLLNKQIEESYAYLSNIKKYVDNIKTFSTHTIYSKFYGYLAISCLDTSRFHEASLFLDSAIDYCKNHNVCIYLRELYFLKGEYYYHLKDEKKFKIWYEKALTLHELIKCSDSEYFETLVENRLKKLEGVSKV